MSCFIVFTASHAWNDALDHNYAIAIQFQLLNVGQLHNCTSKVSNYQSIIQLIHQIMLPAVHPSSQAPLASVVLWPYPCMCWLQYIYISDIWGLRTHFCCQRIHIAHPCCLVMVCWFWLQLRCRFPSGTCSTSMFLVSFWDLEVPPICANQQIVLRVEFCVVCSCHY